MENFKLFMENKKILVLSQLQEFINNNIRNQWLEDNTMQVYVRKAGRFINKKQVTSLDIANIEVRKKYRNQGIASNFFIQAHQMNPWDITYVESILNPELEASLRKKGWIKEKGAVPPAYYLWK